MKKNFLIFFIFVILFLAPANKLFAAGSAFTFKYGAQTFDVSQTDISSWQGAQTINQNPALNPPPADFETYLQNFLGKNPSHPIAPTKTYSFSLEKVYNYIESLSQQINVKTQEPALEIAEGKATTFSPPQTGLSVDIFNSSLAALETLEAGKNSSDLIVGETLPQNPLSQTNTLGINELIAEGVSKFNGSPNNRRHNIAVGLEKFKGIIIPQGAEFSFDDNLGPVTAEAGFLPELVIKGSQGTIPELGGGLCQVSTTTFRAAMAAGLPITARRNHAYAVQYYSPQGTDATIYPGSADLKFINNTPGAILIWPYEKDKNTLVYDFYGTNDGRRVTLEKPVVYDRLPDGSMKATWTRLVTLNGETSTSTFKSVYQPPALFHKTETFITATGTLVNTMPVPKAN